MTHTTVVQQRFVSSVMLGAALVCAPLLAWFMYQSPRAASYTMEAQADMLPHSGLYGPEYLAGWPHPYRWTDGQTTVHLPNPGGHVIVHSVMSGGPERSVPVRVQTAPATLSFVVSAELRTYALLLPPTSEQRFALAFETPTIYANGRTLGMMLSTLRVSGGGAAPWRVVLALLIATIGAYTLLRGMLSPLWSATVCIALQTVVLLWQVAGGWRYALFEPALWLAASASLVAVVVERRKKAHPCTRVSSEPPSHQECQDSNTKPSLPVQGVKHWHVLVVLFVLALCIRLPWLTAADPVGDLELAARRMGFLYHDGLHGAYTYDGDYLPVRLYLLYGLSQLVIPLGGGFHAPLPPITLLLIKLPGLLADLATVALIYGWSLRWQPIPRAAALAALYTLSPPVWMNVAWWGQVDALLMLPLIGMVVLFDKAEGRWSWLCWTGALLIKPQAIVFAPLLYMTTLCLYGRRGFLQGAFLFVGLFSVACVPLVLAEQGPGLLQAYVGSVGRFPKVSIGAYNLWHVLTLGRGSNDDVVLLGMLSYRMIGLVLVASAALIATWSLWRCCNEVMRVRAAIVLALAFFVLPTQIHERYLFLSLAFVTMALASDARLALPYSILVGTATLNILGTLDGFVPIAYKIIDSSPLPMVCAVGNVSVFVFFVGHLFSETKTRSRPSALA